ncbi:MAG: class E sortase [Bacillota bacterium]
MKIRGLKICGFALMAAGVMLMLYPLFTDFYARYQQDKLRAAFIAQEKETTPAQMTNGQDKRSGNSGSSGAGLSGEGPSGTDSPRGGYSPYRGPGWAIIEIPAIDLDALVVRGTSNGDLWRGPGWYEQSALPGEGNTAIAGHRTMYGAWFGRLNRLRPGDSIILRYQGRSYTYRVEKTFSVAKNDWSVIQPCGYPVLTLTTCQPLGSSKKRLIVRAALVNDDSTIKTGSTSINAQVH